MSLAAAWQRRSERERRTLVLVGVLVMGLVLLAFVYLPLDRERKRLAAQLPELRASIAALERDAAEVRRLKSLPVAAAGAAGTPLASLATNSGGLAGGQVTVIDGKRVRVSGADLSFAALLEFLRNAQATHGMRVESARIDRLPTTGRVRAELVLARG